MLHAITRFFGSANDRMIRQLRKEVEAINRLEPKFAALSDSAIKDCSASLKDRYHAGTTLEQLLPEAFALCREASKRVLGQRHFDVQMMGGISLHRGKIIEMRTGEGKTLSSTLPAYLNGLTGLGVHVVTINDYLAERDAKWMGKVFEFLGLSVACIIHGLTDEERQAAYAADITYATNNELGFDYLRDNMKYSRNAIVMRPFNFAIIDEVDSILIDEARTPLIISGPTEDNSTLYTAMAKVVPELAAEDYEVDEKNRTVTLTEVGMEHVEQKLIGLNMIKAEGSLYALESIQLVHHINQALRAHTLFKRDVDYMNKDGKIMIIDEFTGRIMEGRRYSEGLHQALEAKEGVKIQNENQTLASVTYQNFFRLYPKLCGMTGTAMTEAGEFSDIYSLEVVEIPTNLPVQRKDEDDIIYRTMEEKYKAIIKMIGDRHQAGQPILVGTVSIEKSEYLSEMLRKASIPHQVLNARYHEQEAAIIAQAGRFGAVTIATNMAGRGTDIMLGGNPSLLCEEAIAGESDADKHDSVKEVVYVKHAEEKARVLEAGGLLVIGTERHESRRIDNQLRGRSGRQGDPGRTVFYLSLEDDLMRIFGSERLSSMLKTLGLKDDEAIVHPWISRTLAKAQQKVENRNFEMRKNLLKFDNVMNDQRKVIYEQRLEIIDSDDVSQLVQSMSGEVLDDLLEQYCPKRSYKDAWDIDGLVAALKEQYGLELIAEKSKNNDGGGRKELETALSETLQAFYKDREQALGADRMHQLEKHILLVMIDHLWKEHLHTLDYLRQGINLRAYGQKDPLMEYKREAFTHFELMLGNLSQEVVRNLSHNLLMSARQEADFDFEMGRGLPEGMIEHHGEEPELISKKIPASRQKIGRNDPCPCGSGKKYKFCHGAVE